MQFYMNVFQISFVLKQQQQQQLEITNQYNYNYSASKDL